MVKKFTLSFVGLVTAFTISTWQAQAQFAPAPEPAGRQEAAEAPAPAVPDNIRLAILVRNAVVALNQANWTGNYSVLQDMGTPNFQLANNPARLTEIFATLRAQKIDLTPVMVFEPKFTQPPSIGEGDVLRLTGFFPTKPEQVNFELALQHSGEQWQLAAIAVNLSAPGENAQAMANAQPTPIALDASVTTPAKPAEAKPIRIDLSQPAPPPHPKPRKPASIRKPRPSTQKAATAQPPAPAAALPAPEPSPPPSPPASEVPENHAQQLSPSTGSSWNPFGR